MQRIITLLAVAALLGCTAPNTPPATVAQQVAFRQPPVPVRHFGAYEPSPLTSGFRELGATLRIQPRADGHLVEITEVVRERMSDRTLIRVVVTPSWFRLPLATTCPGPLQLVSSAGTTFRIATDCPANLGPSRRAVRLVIGYDAAGRPLFWRDATSCDGFARWDEQISERDLRQMTDQFVCQH